MRVVLQRVQQASVTVENRVVGAIKQGLVLLLGVHQEDQASSIPWLVNKIVGLRIFPNDEQKMHLSVKDVQGAVLVVSQFTLYANCSRGRRPDFINAAQPEKAQALYEQFVAAMKCEVNVVQTGIFGANMQVELINDGPVTLILDRE